MKLLSTLGICMLIAFGSVAQSTQQDIDNPSLENITRLVTQIKNLLDKYPTALAVYKGTEIKDTTAGDGKWFRSAKSFPLATKAVIENEDNSYDLYLTFEGFSKNFFAMGFGNKLKLKLKEAVYSFGQLKEEASGEDGLLLLVPKETPSNEKFASVGIYIHLPNPNGLEDKFGNKRETDVVVRISLSPGN